MVWYLIKHRDNFIFTFTFTRYKLRTVGTHPMFVHFNYVPSIGPAQRLC